MDSQEAYVLIKMVSVEPCTISANADNPTRSRSLSAIGQVAKNLSHRERSRGIERVRARDWEFTPSLNSPRYQAPPGNALHSGSAGPNRGGASRTGHSQAEPENEEKPAASAVPLTNGTAVLTCERNGASHRFCVPAPPVQIEAGRANRTFPGRAWEREQKR